MTNHRPHFNTTFLQQLIWLEVFIIKGRCVETNFFLVLLTHSFTSFCIFFNQEIQVRNYVRVSVTDYFYFPHNETK